MRTVFRGCTTVVLAVVLLAAAAYMAHGVHGESEVSRARQQAADDLEAALPTSRARAERFRDVARAAVERTWGPPAYTWQEVVCDLDSVDAGYIVQFYEQDCGVRSVDLVPVPPADGTTCEQLPLTALGNGASVRRLSRYTVRLTQGPSGAFDDEHPYAHGCPDGIGAPPWGVTTRLVSGRRPTDLGDSPAWLVVIVDVPLSRTDLGCDPWALLFCEAPDDTPVVADPA